MKSKGRMGYYLLRRIHNFLKSRALALANRAEKIICFPKVFLKFKGQNFSPCFSWLYRPRICQNIDPKIRFAGIFMSRDSEFASHLGGEEIFTPNF